MLKNVQHAVTIANYSSDLPARLGIAIKMASIGEGDSTSPVTIENLPDRDFRTGSQQAANKQSTTSVLFNVGIVEILSCNSLYVE